MEKISSNFVEEFIEEDIAAGKVAASPTHIVHTRFPPEPNGYLHIGHAKAICMDFGAAAKYGGQCNLRLDDTNPSREDTEYVDAIKEDIHWLGFDWGDRLFYASDYFQELWDLAEYMIKKGLAYVEEQTSEQIAAQKGTPTQPGVESPFRNRPVEESLDLFRRMNKGEFEEGTLTLRAKIDMANPNMHFRDPIMYRIIKYPHHRTGTTWQAYPMYDFAHGQSDFLEGITHSICTLEFEVHRPLYEYFAKIMAEYKGTEYTPRQIEFNRLNLTNTVMSKRYLRDMVENGIVRGWDDPRMPTLCGLRRRGYTSQAVRDFITTIGYTKFMALNSITLLENAARADLNKKATRVMGVINPVKLTITNWPAGKVEMCEMDNNPEEEGSGKHEMPFSGELYIEREDFQEVAEKKFFRLTIDKEVRLKGAFIIKCTGVEKDAEGNITNILCTYDPESKSGMPGAERKVKGTLHWVSAQHAVPVEARLYNNLFLDEEATTDSQRNPDSEVVVTAYVEPYCAELAKTQPFHGINNKEGYNFQFQRIAYFCVDKDSTPDHLVFNRTVSLKESK
ncbi:MAG: glutamine--tRNA ligase/YqeY domain fusion protein [Bacteroidales bacterium]|nr:glutamine--tRNA ligase/YqeY domain fusion protein [Candidatus Liminaster caballi]